MTRSIGYVFCSQSGHQYAPDGGVNPSIADVAAHNAALAAAEVVRWAQQPDRQLAYYHFPHEPTRDQPWCAAFVPRITDARVTLWMGESIGVIVAANVYFHNRGGRFVSLRVRGSNGREYYGRASWDNGSCIWLRAVGEKRQTEGKRP